MRTAGKLVLAFIVSALATVGLISLLLTARPHLGGPLSAHASKEAAAADGDAGAQRLAASGHLREAQDGYLAMLERRPADPAAMRGLIAVRRAMAGGDPALLRQQAAAYRQLAARHADTPEHYSAGSMKALAAANLQAAAAIESERRAALDAGIGGVTDPRRAAGRPGRNAMRPARGPGAAAPSVQSPPSSPSPAPSAAAAPSVQSPPSSPSPAASAAAAPSPPSQQPGKSAPARPAAGPAAREGAGASTPDGSPAAGAAAPTTSSSPAPSSPPAAAGPAPGNPTDSTVAVVTPPAGPAPAQSQGDLAKVDCQAGTFVLHGANGDEEFATGPGTMIYVRAAKSERVSGVCALEHRLGQSVMVWFVALGDRRVATSVTVVPGQ